MEKLLSELQSFGLEIDHVFLNDNYNRCKCNGSKKKNGWYIGREINNEIFCAYGDWASGKKGFYTTCSNEISKKEIQIDLSEKIKKEHELKKEKSKQLILKILAESVPEDGTHPYLIKKNARPHNTYRYKNNLIIPVKMQGDSEYISCQKITWDCQKWNMTGGVMMGACHVIPGNPDVFCICEGFATGSSINQATGYTVLCAMNDSNMIKIAECLYNSKGNQRIIICCDNDWKKESEKGINAGIKAARIIFEKYGFNYVYPQDIEGTDFNDLHNERGLTYVSEAIIKGRNIEPFQEEIVVDNDKYKEILNPPGLLKDIADYYNATAVKPQPLFAIATGLILGSLVFGRRYNTGDYENYTSLYFLIVAKSGTGKDHVKKIVRSILQSANLKWMERGEGYTASNTVIKSLENQPLQLSFFEEIGQRLKEASNQHKSNAKGVFRKLLDVWSSCHSFVVGEEFSDGTIPKAENPSLTMVGLSTPKALTDAITEDLIEQGFVNRLLPFISKAERSPTPLNKKRTDPPDKIVQWIKNHYLKGNLVENGIAVMPKPEDEIIVPFDEGAIKELEQIEKAIIEKSNHLEKIRLDDLLTRNREMVMRISLIVAVFDDSPEISASHVRWSWCLVDTLYEDYIREIKRKVSGSDFEKAKLECLDFLRKAGKNGIMPKMIPKTSPFSKHPKRIRDEIMSDLQSAGLIDLTSIRSGKRGPATDVWIALN